MQPSRRPTIPTPRCCCPQSPADPGVARTARNSPEDRCDDKRRARARCVYHHRCPRSLGKLCEEEVPPIVQGRARPSDRVPSAARELQAMPPVLPIRAAVEIAVAVGRPPRHSHAFRNGVRMKAPPDEATHRPRYAGSRTGKVAASALASRLAALAANARADAVAGRHRADRRHGCGREADEHVARYAADCVGSLRGAGNPSFSGHLAAPVPPSAARRKLSMHLFRVFLLPCPPCFFGALRTMSLAEAEHHRIHRR